ncbi:hypothetical protein ACFL0P_00470 [Candidatus Omnitrophota bacterium]
MSRYYNPKRKKNLYTPDMIRILLLIAIFIFNSFVSGPIYGVTLDERYGPILEKDTFLYKGEAGYFELDEQGYHGHGSFNDFNSNPKYHTFQSSLEFSPLKTLEVEAGLSRTFPEGYERLVYNTAGALSALYEYNLDYFQEYDLGLRKRCKDFEVYFNFSGKYQKADWNYAPYPSAANFFTCIRTHYEDFKLGLKHVSASKDKELSSMEKIRGPFLAKGQANVEIEIGYKQGEVIRDSNSHHYYHTLNAHAIPKLTVRYGLDEDLEIEGGVFYTTPFVYEYEYNLYSTGEICIGEYELENNFYFPIKLKYCHDDKLLATLSTDINVIDQNLDYVQGIGAATEYPSRSLTYYNISPTITLSYLCDKGKDIKSDKFSSLTKELLLKKQFLIDFKYKKDITHLSKGSTNAAQNIIDPYNVFMYPLDYFIVGTEYAAFLAGNVSSAATNINPQNYYVIETAFTYGIADFINANFMAGYRSESSLHHFTLNDLKRRFYDFQPYYYFGAGCDWRIGKNSLVSLSSKFVPTYKTFLVREGDPEQYEVENEYFQAALGVKIIF